MAVFEKNVLTIFPNVYELVMRTFSNHQLYDRNPNKTKPSSKHDIQKARIQDYVTSPSHFDSMSQSRGFTT